MALSVSGMKVLYNPNFMLLALFAFSGQESTLWIDCIICDLKKNANSIGLNMAVYQWSHRKELIGMGVL